MNSEPRTLEKVLDIISKIEQSDRELELTETKGIVGRSLLLDVENFDFINGVPCEYMHLGCLGVVKRLTELTFNVGVERIRTTQRRLSSTNKFNILMMSMLLPREFPRRARALDFAVFKAIEFRNILIFYFPFVLECIEKPNKERNLWLWLAFAIRACVLPENEFNHVSQISIESSCQKFYETYENLFGKRNCTYSTHTLLSHLLQIRLQGPLTETSAFVFESFYGELRNSFVPGTCSPLKQMFKKVLLKRSLAVHACEKTIHFSCKDTAKESNSLIYTFNNNVHNIYKITEIDNVNHQFVCKPHGKFDAKFEEVSLNWTDVGVFKKGPIEPNIVVVDKNKVAGKVLNVGKFLITCPKNVLLEN